MALSVDHCTASSAGDRPNAVCTCSGLAHARTGAAGETFTLTLPPSWGAAHAPGVLPLSHRGCVLRVSPTPEDDYGEDLQEGRHFDTRATIAGRVASAAAAAAVVAAGGGGGGARTGSSSMRAPPSKLVGALAAAHVISEPSEAAARRQRVATLPSTLAISLSTRQPPRVTLAAW